MMLATVGSVLPLAADVSIAVTQAQYNPVFPSQFAPGSSLTLAAVGGTSASLQWYHNGQAVPGATAATLRLDPLGSADTGNYTLQADTAGVIDTSNTLTINVLPFPPSPVDPTFNAQLQLPNFDPIRVFPGAADGSLIVVCAPSVPLSYSLGTSGSSDSRAIRLRADGSRDGTLDLHMPDGDLLAVLPDGDLILRHSPNRRRLDGSIGTLMLPVGFDPVQNLSQATVQPDGRILVVQYHQASNTSSLGRVNADGSVDATFLATTIAGPAQAPQVDGSGRIIISSDGVVDRLNADGTHDATFHPAKVSYLLNANPLPDGSILFVPNYFSRTQNAPDAVRLNGDGSVNAGWSASNFFFYSYAIAVDAANYRVFFVDQARILRRVSITASGLANDPTFYQGEPNDLRFTPVESLHLTLDGKVLQGLVRLDANQHVAALPPVVSSLSAFFNPGDSSLTFTAAASGIGLPTYPLDPSSSGFTYQWSALDGQAMPASSTSSTLVIPHFDSTAYGRYQLRLTGPGGSVLSQAIPAGSSLAQTPYLANLSARAYVGAGEATPIAGFVSALDRGSRGLPLLLRGAGPALAAFGVNDYLPNPVIRLYDNAGQMIASDDDWANVAELSGAAQLAGAFPLAAASKDAALRVTLGTARASVHLLDQGNTNGIGLAEIYRLPLDPVIAGDFANPISGALVNLSLRAQTGEGERVATVGFVVADPQGKGRSVRLLLRVVGPTLAAFGVGGALADPVLTLYDAKGGVVARNDNWSANANAAEVSAATTQVGAFFLPAASKDAALLLDVPAGVYSIQATAASGSPSTGVTLTEIYLVR